MESIGNLNAAILKQVSPRLIQICQRPNGLCGFVLKRRDQIGIGRVMRTVLLQFYICRYYENIVIEQSRDDSSRVRFFTTYSNRTLDRFLGTYCLPIHFNTYFAASSNPRSFLLQINSAEKNCARCCKPNFLFKAYKFRHMALRAKKERNRIWNYWKIIFKSTSKTLDIFAGDCSKCKSYTHRLT